MFSSKEPILERSPCRDVKSINNNSMSFVFIKDLLNNQ